MNNDGIEAVAIGKSSRRKMMLTSSNETHPITSFVPKSRASACNILHHLTCKMRYGQVVVGPCGSGKTTYCDGMQQYLKLLGRDAVVVNLDPANHFLEEDTDGNMATSQSTSQQSEASNVNTALLYTAIYDVCIEAVNLKVVMKQLSLGPNGGLMYCMEYLEVHAQEVIDVLLSRSSPNSYFIFDFPGQVELYTHSTCVQNFLRALVTKMDMRLTAVQLVDALYCTDVTKFISAAVLGTTTMLRLELPMVNVLSKVDLLTSYGALPLQFDFFTECHDLERLVPFLYQSNNDEQLLTSADEDKSRIDGEVDIADDPEYQRALHKRRNGKLALRHEKLHRSLAEIVDDYSLLSFLPLDITSAESVGRVLAKIDKCNGYVFTNTTGVNEDLFKCAIQSDDIRHTYESVSDVRERIASPESIQDLR
jgi:GPN-loop GTPase